MQTDTTEMQGKKREGASEETGVRGVGGEGGRGTRRGGGHEEKGRMSRRNRKREQNGVYSSPRALEGNSDEIFSPSP